MAGAVASLLALVISGIVLVGVLATPWLIDAIAPGFTGEKRELTIRIVRILFPGAGLLVLSAWCLGVLNSHHRFLLSYTAPVMWNAAMIATLLIFGGRTALPRLAELLAWGSVVGSALQFAVQVPIVLRVAPDLRFAFDTASEDVRTVVRNFVPVFVSRGVVQVSAYIDQLLAELSADGRSRRHDERAAPATLPVSLFGMSVSAAELPAMSGVAGSARQPRRSAQAPRRRAATDRVLRRSLRRGVPRARRYRRGAAAADRPVWTWRRGVRLGNSRGFGDWVCSRRRSAVFTRRPTTRLRDTRTPLNFAVVRVALTTVLGYLFAIPLPRALGVDQSWGAAGLTASAGIAGWVEMLCCGAR